MIIITLPRHMCLNLTGCMRGLPVACTVWPNAAWMGLSGFSHVWNRAGLLSLVDPGVTVQLCDTLLCAAVSAT